MKKRKLSIKKHIAKKIDYQTKSIRVADKPKKESVEVNKNQNKSTVEIRREARTGGIENANINDENYEYDVIISIPTYNRYDKIVRLINQFMSQQTKIRFKIIILNDGSTDERYKNIIDLYPDIDYIENEKSNGKTLHWYCYNQLWSKAKEYKFRTILQMDDDFIISEQFLDNIFNIFLNEKRKNDKILGISPHLWSFKKSVNYERWWSFKFFVDGICLIDYSVLNYLNFGLKPVDAEKVIKPGEPVKAWTQIGDGIKNMGGFIHRTKNSLVYHDGNNDSKLHGDVRVNGKLGVYTQKYIGKI